MSESILGAIDCCYLSVNIMNSTSYYWL